MCWVGVGVSGRIVFLSYARKDAALVEELRDHLRSLERQAGVRVWMDDEIEGGEAWEARIRARLTEAVAVVACVTPRFLASPWCQDEARFAREARKPILPVHVSKFSARTDVFSDLQYVPDLSRPVMAWGNETHHRDDPWSMVVDALGDLLDRVEREAAAREAAAREAEARKVREAQAAAERAAAARQAREAAARAAEAREAEARRVREAQEAAEREEAARQAREAAAREAAAREAAALAAAAREAAAQQARWTTLVPPLVNLPAGKFIMGSPPGVGYDAEHPAHEVKLTRPYAMGVTPVTQAQWQQVVAAAQAAPWAGEEPGLAGLSPNPSHFTTGAEAADRPVEQVSWLDTVTWCNALSRLTGRRPAYQRTGDQVTWAATADGFRLPTEAEWEHACRAGTTTSWWHGDDEAGLAKVAWYDANANDTTHPVGKKLPNPWGLHDVHGNVWEWCWDWGDASYYAQSPKADPAGPPRGELRVMRGGCGWNTAGRCRSACRLWRHPGVRDWNRGFRVVLSPPPELLGSRP